MTGNMERQNVSKSAAERLKEAAEAVLVPKLPIGLSVPVLPPPPDSWQIVVVGNIDPRQHHPTWYRQIGGISDGEFALAMKTLTGFIPPPMPGTSPTSFVQFDTGDFALAVVGDRWTIQTTAEAGRRRMLDVVSLVFDEKLFELSITAFGINRNWTVKLESMTASQFLGHRLQETNLAFPKGNGTGGPIFFSNPSGEFDTTYTISPMLNNEKWLQVAYNRHHPIPKSAGKPFYFALGEMVKGNAESDWQSAVQYGLELEGCVARAEVQKNGN